MTFLAGSADVVNPADDCPLHDVELSAIADPGDRKFLELACADLHHAMAAARTAIKRGYDETRALRAAERLRARMKRVINGESADPPALDVNPWHRA